MAPEPYPDPFTPSPITRYKDEKFHREEGLIALEVPLTFVVNGTELGTMMCTPSHLKAFTFGFLFTSGVITSAKDILSWDVDPRKWRVAVTVSKDFSPELLGQRVYTSGCGKGVMFTSAMELSGRYPMETKARLSVPTILDAMAWLVRCSDLHKKTGGVHSAALSIDDRLPESHIDDIGRHNTVDKLIGTLLINPPASDNIALISTGRISSEILHKARRIGIPIIVSRGAPTHQGILLAKEMGMTVVGFVRAKNFAIYSHPERVILP